MFDPREGDVRCLGRCGEDELAHARADVEHSSDAGVLEQIRRLARDGHRRPEAA